MKTCVLIPARMGSSRLPNKPLALINGQPMIVRVYQQACAADVGPVYVACDGPEVLLVIKCIGGHAIITDPDLPSGSDRIWAALQQIDQDFDVIVNLQGDLPTISPQLIQAVLKPLENPDIDIATLGFRHDDDARAQNPNDVCIALSASGEALYFSREALPYGETSYIHHIGIYAYRRQALEKFVSLPPSPLEKRERLEQLRALEAGMRIGVALVDEEPVGVDTMEDLQKVRNA
ncbi:MAG: 3-deoxy-manno-octulosonate cytidylyltransferase [Alphaproteobacteria bacterium]